MHVSIRETISISISQADGTVKQAMKQSVGLATHTHTIGCIPSRLEPGLWPNSIGNYGVKLAIFFESPTLLILTFWNFLDRFQPRKRCVLKSLPRLVTKTPGNIWPKKLFKTFRGNNFDVKLVTFGDCKVSSFANFPPIVYTALTAADMGPLADFLPTSVPC